MSIDGFEIKFGGADSAGLDLQRQTQVVSEAIDQLEREVRTVKSEWVGEASEEYDRRLADWRKNVEDMRALLNSAQVSLDDITDRYRRGDLQEAGNWQGRR